MAFWRRRITVPRPAASRGGSLKAPDETDETSSGDKAGEAEDPARAPDATADATS
jgi:hypothetical protein